MTARGQYNRPPRARSSVGERSLHTREVAGSKPAAPIEKSPAKAAVSFTAPRLPLLRQPHGFEGLIAVEEDADATDLAVDDVVDVIAVGCNGDAADAPGRGGAHNDQDPVAANRLYTINLDPKV